MEINNAIALVTGANGSIGGHFNQLLQLQVAKIYVCGRSIRDFQFYNCPNYWWNRLLACFCAG
jgi:NADP-dependent 3-hydroxy acid dehydrogenase YdfG